MNITILLPAGQLPLEIMQKAHDLAEIHHLGIYLSTLQNLRLTNVPEEKLEAIKSELAELGADFKAPGKFPLPRVCVGKPHCNLGIIDTVELSEKIMERFKNKKTAKPKFKIAVAGCTLCCPGAMLTDISIIATRSGFDVIAGGKAGPAPKTGKRILKGVSETQALDAVEKLVQFHDTHTNKKQRIYKLLDHPDFPWPKNN